MPPAERSQNAATPLAARAGADASRQTRAARLRGWLFQPVDAAWLAVLRMLFGAIMFGSTLRMLILGSLSDSKYSGWVEAFFIRPAFHFKYWGFSWVQPPPDDTIYGVLWGLVVLSVAVAAGLCFRWTSAALLIGFVYVELIDATFYVNHYYLLSLLALLLAVSPAGDSWSLDAWLAKHAGRPSDTPQASVNRVWLVVFRFQIAIVYSFAGLAKAHADWLIHAQPLRIWLAAKTQLPVLGPLLLTNWAAPAMSWAGFLFDTSIPWLLMIARLRPLAYCGVIAFHVLTYLLFPRITMFPVIMIAAALVFFPPDWPRRLAARWRGRGASSAPVHGPRPIAVPSTTRRQNAGLWVLGIYALIQVLVPLRFLLYGGDVRWHEQGLRFSWRVLHREKLGSVTFQVRSKTTGQSWEVEPSHYLHPIQETELGEQPDLILQLAHHIRDDFARRGLGPVEVRARALCTLNGRPSALLIDPKVDLAGVEDSLAPTSWILPVPTSAPPHNRATL